MQTQPFPEPRYRWEVAQGDTLEACFALRSHQYSRYYENVPKQRFTDDFDNVTVAGKPASFTLAIREDDELVGTVRMLLARHPEYGELKCELADMMNLDWTEFASTLNCAPEKLAVGEMGKFAVCDCRDRFRAIWATGMAAGQLSVSLGLEAVICMMPPRIEQLIRRVGIRFEKMQGVQLRRDCRMRLRLLLKYHDYFLPKLGELGVQIDFNQVGEATTGALNIIAGESSDGPVMWWIRADQLANASFPETKSKE